MTGIYDADARSALADLKAAGVPVTFTLGNQGTTDAATDITTPAADVVVSGYAIEKKGSLFMYEKLGLVMSKTRTLVFGSDPIGTLPPDGSTITWAGEMYTVKNVAPISPAGDPLLATVVVSL